MSQHYTATAKTLHWLITVLLLGLLGLGFYMQGLPLSPEKLKLYSWHKWAGVTVFLMVIVRLAWRVTHQPPPLPSAKPRVQQWVAHAGHIALYMQMLSIPLSGWLMSSAKGFQTVWFGVLPLPDLVGKDQVLGALLLTVHQVLNLALVAVVIGHVGAALKHHFVDKDDVLTRMLPRTSASAD
jgi:cytochrome b561